MTGRSKALVAGIEAVMAAGVCMAQPAQAAHPCAACHPAEVAGYAATQMAHSLGRPASEPAGKFTHAPSKTQFWIVSRDSKMVQGLERNGVKGEYDVAYAVGSGAHAFAYLIELGGRLFESPLGYFPGRGWDMSPGFEDAKAPDFYRPVTPDCLFCHSGRARPAPGAYNTYQDPAFDTQAITCERCHGPVEAHLRNPVPGSIVNPASLPNRARDSVCEQCHLVGEERIPNPG
ncbi:MAG TPA: multiheme c-type cytochrome, partial [Terriglobia bacterium]|nr:multiheme c-type cytochrome [Terriglobia bacterium]